MLLFSYLGCLVDRGSERVRDVVQIRRPKSSSSVLVLRLPELEDLERLLGSLDAAESHGAEGRACRELLAVVH